MMPASDSLLAFTIIMNFIVVSPAIRISNDEPNSPGSRHGGIEERRDRGCQHGRRENAVMRQARQNSEPGIGHPRPIPAAILLAAAKQLEEQHGIFRSYGIRNSRYQPTRRHDRR